MHVWGPCKRKGSRNWQVRFGLKGERWKSTGTADLGEARRFLVAFEADLKQRGVVGSILRLTPEIAWARYEALFGVRLADRTMIQRRSDWGQFWEAVKTVERAGAVGGMMLRLDFVDQLTPGVVIRVQAELAKGRAGSSVNGICNSVNVVLKALVRVGESAPVDAFRGVRRLREDEVERPWIQWPALSALLEAARVEDAVWPGARLFVALGAFAGLRPGESVAARWDWIVWPTVEGQSGHIRIPQQDEGWRPKNRKGRAVPLHAGLLELLRAAYPGQDCGRLPISPAAAHHARWFGGLVARALPGVADFTPHCLRHSFASNAAVAGVDLYRIQMWMGHSSPRMTARYAHLIPHDNRVSDLYGAGLGAGNGT